MLKWDMSANLYAFEGVEKLEHFTNKEELDAYRKERKTFAGKIVPFMRRHIPAPWTVLDIGSGSSCLLYKLDDEGLLATGTGVEIALSRHRFAQRWKEDCGYKRVNNLHMDIRALPKQKGIFNLCTITDNTLAYFYPIDPDMPAAVLRKAAAALKRGGYLFIQLSRFPQVRTFCNDSEYFSERIELPSSNKFGSVLYRSCLDRALGVIRTESHYMPRNGAPESVKIEHSKLYTLDLLNELLTNCGFSVFYTAGDSDDAPYDHETSPELLTIARKTIGDGRK